MNQGQSNDKNLASEIYPDPDKISEQLKNEEKVPEEKYSYWPILGWQLPLLIIILITSAFIAYRDGTTGAVFTENFGRYKNYLDKSLITLSILFIISAFFQSNSFYNSSNLSIFRISMILFMIALLLVLLIPPVEAGALAWFLAMLIMVIGLFLLIINLSNKNLGLSAKSLIKFTITWLIVLAISYVYFLRVIPSYFRDYGEETWREPLMEKQSMEDQKAFNEFDTVYQLYLEGKTDEAKVHCQTVHNMSYSIDSTSPNMSDLLKKQQLCNHLLYGNYPDPYATQ